MGRLNFADVVTYEKFKEHLARSNAICYISGTGSGKSYWVENILYKHGRVLFVTSRKTKLGQDLKHIDTTNSLNEILNKENDRHHLVTNHGLANIVRAATAFRDDGLPEKYCLEQYVNLFDYIVIDEVHSIVSDAAFSDDSCIVQYFMEYAVDIGKTVVLLTATDKLLENYLEKPIGENLIKWYKVDITDECVSTLPKIVMKITKEYALKKVFTEHLGVHKMIYFVNKTSTIKDCYKLFNEGENKNKEKFMPKSKKMLKENQIAVMVSDNSKESLEEENVITLYSGLAEEKLKKEDVLPEETMLLMATSRLKEGVSIKNDNTFIVICDSHNIVDLVQYMGRLRKSDYILYIISDSIPHDNELDEIEYNYSFAEEVKAANNFFKKLTTAHDKNSFVNSIERKHKYIRFNPIVQEFALYSARHQIENFQQQIEENANKEQECVWELDLELFCNKNKILFDTDIKDYKMDIDEIIEDLKSNYYFNDKPIELYDDTFEELKTFFQAKFNIKHKRPTEINEDLRKIIGDKARIEIKQLKYGKPSDNSVSTKKHIYILDIEKK